jgi:hypothetical protein
MVDELLARFSVKAPATVMFRSLFSRLFSADGLNQLFSSHRRRQFESPISFSYLVHLLTPVVAGSRKSVNASYLVERCEQSRQAVYDKLQKVEPNVSSALVSRSAEQLRAVLDQAGIQYPDILPGYHTFVIDGKTYNATEHRIEETRRDARAPLPGRAVAVLDTRYRLFTEVECSLNAHRCERKIAEPLLERLQSGAVYIADRNFSDGQLLYYFFNQKSYFIIRQHGTCPSWRELETSEPLTWTADADGNQISEQPIEVRLSDDSWQKTRRICVKLKSPTRDGERLLYILSNLPGRVTAEKIAQAYRGRWKIETCLGHLATALNAEIKTLCYPNAAGLCFCIALMLHNILSTIRALIERHGQLPEKEQAKGREVSFYYLALDIAENQGGMEIAFDADYWETHSQLSLAKYSKLLISIAEKASLLRYLKTTRGPKKKPPGKRKFDGTRHVAVQKLIEQRK